jgi:hypothetical protein
MIVQSARHTKWRIFLASPVQFNTVQLDLHFFLRTYLSLLLPDCGSLFAIRDIDNMASTSNLPLADFTRHHSSHGLPCPQSQNSVPRETVPIDTRDTENAWPTEQQLPAHIGEREQVNLPRADGGKEAWLFLCGCFTIEALVWGTLNT